jgi:hypothetical protein
VIEEAATDRIPTIDLLRALVDLEEGPWRGGGCCICCVT